MNEHQIEMIHNLNLTREDGTYSLWDHPNFRSKLVLPAKNYRPILSLREAIEDMNRWSNQIYEERITLLKVLGDAVCANENQLRRYMRPIISPSATSAHIKTLRERGFVERHKCELDFETDENGEPLKLINPAPITLGTAGYFVLNHYYSGMFLPSPENWYNGDRGASIQRFVAMNEIRCCAVESKLAKGWQWYPSIGGSNGYKKPFAVMEVSEKTNEVNRRIHMIIERGQMKQNFVGFFKTRLELFRTLMERDQFIKVDGTPDESVKVVVLSVSSYRMAMIVHEEIGLHKYPFDVLVLVDEWFDTGESPITSAFAHPVDKDSLKRIRVSF